MTSWRTANTRRRHAHRKGVLIAAFEFDLSQLAKGRDRSNSGYVRRRRLKGKLMRVTESYISPAVNDMHTSVACAYETPHDTAQRLAREEFGACSSWRKGAVVQHPNGYAVEITDGFFQNPQNGRVSNFWHWKRLDTGEKGHGYGW